MRNLKKFQIAILSFFSLHLYSGDIPKYGQVRLKIFPINYELYVDGKIKPVKKIDKYNSYVYIERGKHELEIKSPGYFSKKYKFSCRIKFRYFFHHFLNFCWL